MTESGLMDSTIEAIAEAVSAAMDARREADRQRAKGVTRVELTTLRAALVQFRDTAPKAHRQQLVHLISMLDQHAELATDEGFRAEANQLLRKLGAQTAEQAEAVLRSELGCPAESLTAPAARVSLADGWEGRTYTRIEQPSARELLAGLSERALNEGRISGKQPWQVVRARQILAQIGYEVRVLKAQADFYAAYETEMEKRLKRRPKDLVWKRLPLHRLLPRSVPPGYVQACGGNASWPPSSRQELQILKRACPQYGSVVDAREIVKAPTNPDAAVYELSD